MLLFCSCITQCVLCSWCIPVLVVAQDQLACPSALPLVVCSATAVVPLVHHQHLHHREHELEPPPHLIE